MNNSGYILTETADEKRVLHELPTEKTAEIICYEADFLAPDLTSRMEITIDMIQELN